MEGDAALQELPNLRVIIGDHPGLRKVALSTVSFLDLSGFGKGAQSPEDASLAFLEAWPSLKTLILTSSGTLQSLETLESLHCLERIQLRGSATSRDQWPDALQPLLDFISGQGSILPPKA